MAHIATKNELPGIQDLFMFRPETAKPLQALAQQLLRGPSSLSPQERELLAAVTSKENACVFCESSHSAAACALAGDSSFVQRAQDDVRTLTPKMQALVAIAKKVARGGKQVTPTDVAVAKEAGATDVEVHDAVLIAAAFCMFNRYVDGLGATTPTDPAAYVPMGQMLAERGYVR